MAPQFTVTKGLPLRSPRTLDGAGQDFLADARFALDDDRDVGAGGALGEPQHAAHVRAARGEILEPQGAVGAALHAPDLAFQRADAQRVLDRHLQALGADRLDDEIGRTSPHGRDNRLDRPMRRLNDDRQGDVALAHGGEHAHAVEVGHDQVEDDERDRGALGGRQYGERRVAAFRQTRLISETADHGLEKPTLNGIVVDDQNGMRHAGDAALEQLCRFDAMLLDKCKAPLNETAACGCFDSVRGMRLAALKSWLRRTISSERRRPRSPRTLAEAIR